MERVNAFDGGVDKVGEAVVVAKKPKTKKIIILACVAVVAAVAVVAQFLLLAPRLSNDVDLEEYWDEVVAGVPYFYEDMIYYQVASGYREGNFKQVGEQGAIAKMGLDGKNREVLVEAAQDDNSWFSYDSGLKFVGVIENNLYYMRGSSWRSYALYAIDLKAKDYRERLVVQNIDSDMAVGSIKDGWGYYYSNGAIMRVELLSGKKERVGKEAISSMSSWKGEVYYLDAGALWKMGKQATIIWEIDGESAQSLPGGLIVRDKIAYFMVDDRIVKVDIDEGELLDEIILDKMMWTEESIYTADEKTVVYGLFPRPGVTAPINMVSLDFENFEANVVARGIQNIRTDYADMHLLSGRYIVVEDWPDYSGKNAAVIDLKSGDRRVVFSDVSVFRYSTDGYVYIRERTLKNRENKYEIRKMEAGALLEDIRYDI